MARVKLSEHDAKHLIYPVFNLDYQGISFTNTTPNFSKLAEGHERSRMVLKVDQGVKKRGKQGLIKLNIKKDELAPTIHKWSKLGYSNFLLEPMVKHEGAQEQYLALERTREGWLLSHSDQGGVEIESNWDSVTRTLLNRNSRLQVEKGSPAGERRVLAGKGESLSKLLPPLIKKLDELHITFLEINPFVMDKEQIIPLDMAVEIDSTALSLINQTLPFPLSPVQDFDLSPVESRIRELDAATPAALKFNLLNPAGRIWMLLSGGGASLVLADEVADLGLGSELANYGEYSGAPSTDDTYAYTKLILTQILKTDHNQSQALIIAGGVANFTDVKKTFLGIIQALDEVKAKLVKKNLRIFVRRGGPNEEAGLHLMRDFLEGADLIGSVHGHTSPLTTVVKEVGEYLS